MSERWAGSQIVVRTLVVVGVVAALAATALEGVAPAPWLLVLTTALAAGFALLPESPLGTVCFLVVLAWWGIAFRGDPGSSALVAALGLLVAHVAGVLAAYGPRSLPVDPATARLWLRRGVSVFVAAPVVWLVADALEGQPEPPGVWVVGLAAATVCAVVANAAFSVEEEEQV